MTVTDDWTIDADTHVYDPISIWTDFMDPAYTHRAPEWIHADDGRQMVRVGDLIFPTVPAHPGFGRIYGPDSTVDRSGNDPHERLRLMDKLQCEAQVIFPTLGMTGFSLSWSRGFRPPMPAPTTDTWSNSAQSTPADSEG